MFQRPSPVFSPLARVYPALIALSLMSLGCGRITRIKQCRALVAQVNPALDEVLSLTSTNTGSSGYRAAAARYERLAKTLGPMEFSSEPMALSVADYAGMVETAAQNLRSFASALDAKDNASADKANLALQRLSAREHGAVAQIDGWCRAID